MQAWRSCKAAQWTARRWSSSVAEPIRSGLASKLARQAIKAGDRVAALTGAKKISRPVRRRHLRLAGLGAIVPVEVPAASPRLAKVPVNWVQGRNWDRVPPSRPIKF